MLRMALSREKKAEYKVTIQTGNRAGASTINSTYIKLVGTDGESNRTWAEGPLSFFSGPESTVTVSCPKTIGKLVLIEIDKKGVQVFPDWFLAKVEVKSPEGDTYTFPIHHWITDTKVHRFTEGTACRIFEVDRMIQKELLQRMDDYRWKVYKDGMPHCIEADSPESLPPEVRFSFIKSAQFTMTAVTGKIDLKWKGLAGREEKWKDIEEIHQEFRKNKTNQISDYVQEHWREDTFFGYQYLNGVNPMMIRRCTALPCNFPVTDDMVFPCGGCTLKTEMKRGNIFLADYKLLDGVKTNTINGKKQYLMAPLVLLRKTADDQLMPIAIQLKQTPADDNPIFFPTDSEYDWLMAKIFVRSADFNLHQLNVHLLRTHLLPEVFAVSLLRNVPMVHPLYKLLKPHTRYTLQINIMARQSLISEDGVFTQFAASGGEDMITILRRSLNKITYSSLCIPEDIAERGLEAVPNFYYRDDGLRLWDIIHRVKMVDYKVTVFTGSLDHATTYNDVYIKLVGTDGESHRTRLIDYKGPLAFIRGAVSSFTVSCSISIGKLVLIELDKQRFSLFPKDAWFPAKVEIESPEGDTYTVPIYRWITDSEVHRFREGTALRVFEDNHHLGRYSREKELKRRKEQYRWDVYKEGIPHCIKAGDACSLPPEVRFSFTKTIQFAFTGYTGMIELKLEGLANCKKKWKDIHHLNRAFWHKTHMADYVQKHWKEDVFFGYQYLNGINPMLIRRCTNLPSNFPVTDDMVFPHGQSSLGEEMKKGNIFLVDYKLLDGVKPNVINRKKQYLMAPLVLLHKTTQDELMPIAIQLKQTPAGDNPIFFPTDSEYDWLMAKIFVRSADFNMHQLNAHLLRTHLLAEVFTVSLLRNVPMVHPLYKLLIPHTRYTLQINIMARCFLISKTGVFTKFAASGGEGMITILKRSMSSMTYSSLCIPEDIAERGLEDVPNFYYRDDGLRLWDIINRFVQGVLSYYYKNDAEVKQDSELQKWISDIFVHGFLSKKSTGIPQSFTSVTELVKFVTMVIFTCSAQHAAVNSGQYDYGGWMPNAPSSLQRPPPTKKGTTNKATMLETFPDVNTTANGMAAVLLLSKQSSDFVRLGDYPEERFTEEIPLKLIKEFQGELEGLSDAIKDRNRSLDVPYTYLNPTEVENSVSL